MSTRTMAEEILKIQNRDKKIRRAVDAFHRKIGSEFYYLQECEVQKFIEDQQDKIDELEAKLTWATPTFEATSTPEDRQSSGPFER